MMDRTNFVGTIIPFTLEEGEKKGKTQEYLINQFMGEGAESVVFGIAPLDDPTNNKWVIKLHKTTPAMEMDTLHYSLRVHEGLYPNHPLRMSPQDRMRKLTGEIMRRMRTERVTFRVEAYSDLLEQTLIVLAQQFADKYEAGTLQNDFLKSPILRESIDDSLLYRIQEVLDEDQIEPRYRDFFGFVAEQMERQLPSLEASGEILPLSKNPLYGLLGFHLAGFISDKELFAIASDAEFRSVLKPFHLDNFFQLIAMLFYTASGHARNPSALRTAAISACDLLEYVAGLYGQLNRHSIGLSKFWKAKICLLEQKDPDAVSVGLEAALPFLDEPGSLPDRHDVLIELVSLYETSKPDRALEYIDEAQQIEERLGIPEGQRTREIK
jgi:hypothetical protein